MAQQLINIGAVADDGTGDNFRDAFDKTNDNFTELFAQVDPTNQIIVNAITDFPAAVGGVITLLGSTFYLVGDEFSLGDTRIVLSDDTVLAGLDSSVSKLTYTGTGDMFTAVDASNKVTRIRLDCPSGRVFNISSPGNTSVFQFVDATVDSCDRIGVFNNLRAMQVSNVAYNSVVTDGHSFVGTFNVFTAQTNLSTMSAGALYSLGTATFDAFNLTGSLVSLASGSFLLSGAAASANITVGNIGLVTGSRIFGAGASTPLSTITRDDIRWEFFANDEIGNSATVGLLSMQGNATTTTIAVSGTYVLAAGAWVVENTSRMTGTTAGRLTANNGTFDADITISVTAEPVSGNAKIMSARVALNGVTIVNSTRSSSADAGKPASITIPWLNELTETDFIEVFVTNDTDTIDILVSSALMRIH